MSESWTMAGIGGGTVVPIVELACLSVAAGILVGFFRRKKLLIVTVQAILSVFAVLRANAAEVTTNEVLFVDQKGNVSRPETLATTADMAANKAALITAEEKAAAAEAAARAGTNLVADIVADIGRNELVVYRYGFTDGFSAAVVFDPDAKLLTSSFEVLNETSGDLAAFRLKYAVKNSQAVDIQPVIKWRSSINSGADYEALPTTQVEPMRRLDETYTDGAGVIYPYVYEVKCYAPATAAGFFIVVLIPDDAAGDGLTMELPNGITGGLTARVPFGNSVLVIEGGIVVGVE